MKAEMARKLAIRQSQIMERYDHWSYADLLADFDNNEELMLEYLVKQTIECPELIISGMLDTMECMVDELAEV